MTMMMRMTMTTLSHHQRGIYNFIIIQSIVYSEFNAVYVCNGATVFKRNGVLNIFDGQKEKSLNYCCQTCFLLANEGIIEEENMTLSF